MCNRSLVYGIWLLGIVGCGSPAAERETAAESATGGNEATASEEERAVVEPSTGPISPIPAHRIYRVVPGEAESLQDALADALESLPVDSRPSGTQSDLAFVIRRPTGRCTYVWGAEARARYVRWLRALGTLPEVPYGLVAHWEGGATVLEIEGLDLVGACPGTPGTAFPATAPDPAGVRTVRAGPEGPWMDVPRLYQRVANGARVSFELLGDSVPIGVFPESGEFERHAHPASGVDLERESLPSGAELLRRTEGDTVSVYTLVEVDGQRWLCGCDGSLEAVCRSCRAAP